MHRDLKPENILLHFPENDLLNMSKKERDSYIKNFSIQKTPFRIKISDFGFIKPIENVRHTICGTAPYMPPD